MALHRRPVPSRDEIESVCANILSQKVGISHEWALIVARPMIAAAMKQVDEGILAAMEKLREDA